MLDRFFEADQICPWQLWAELPQNPDFKPYSLIRGHFGGGGLKRWLPQGSPQLTMLREPGALLLSTFGHIERESGTRFHAEARQMDLGEFLTHPDTQMVLSNRQTAFLSFDPRQDPAAGLNLFAPRSAERVASEVVDDRVQVSDAQRLERAIEVLEACVWFGLLERFEDSMWMLARHFAAPPVGRLHQARNEAADRARNRTSAAGFSTQIKALTELDQALYDAAIPQFEARLADAKRHIDLGPKPDGRKPRELEPGERLRYDFGSVLLGSGWHARERKLPEGDYFRWTGPDPVSLLLLPCLSTQLGEVRLRVVNGVSDRVMEAMTVRLNGVKLVPEDLEGSGPVREFRVVVPDEVRQPVQLSLEICLPYTQQHREANPDTDDSREVGVAIHWIEMRGLDRVGTS